MELVESMHLTSDQKTKIDHLTAAQTARCNEEKRLHRTTHEQILALLTPDQHQTLQASENSDHGHKNHASADVELAAHA